MHTTAKEASSSSESTIVTYTMAKQAPSSVEPTALTYTTAKGSPPSAESITSAHNSANGVSVIKSTMEAFTKTGGIFPPTAPPTMDYTKKYAILPSSDFTMSHGITASDKFTRTLYTSKNKPDPQTKSLGFFFLQHYQ